MNIKDIFNEADSIIKKASAKAPEKSQVKTASIDPEIGALADGILNGKFETRPEPVLYKKTASVEMSPMEKIAHSVAIVDTLLNIAKMQELEKFASIAEERGYTPEQIKGYLEKRASEMELLSVAPLLHLTTTMPEAAEVTKTAMQRASSRSEDVLSQVQKAFQ